MQEGKIFTNDKCTGCNLCIANCPCNEANMAVYENGRNKIYVDAKKCIICGECVNRCPHQARDYLDDTEQFFKDLSAGMKISVITAPALRTNFPEYERVLGFLREMGVNFIFDASFGADISIWAYLRNMDPHENDGTISQPCPAIVNYIERYKPQLLTKLSPAQSPVMCSAIYMKKYMYIPGAYALLSPCIAKREEILDDNNGGLITYNITFRKLAQWLEAHQKDYLSCPPSSFDNDQHGLGAVFPLPGGLKTNIRQYLPDAWIHQAEGQPYVCDFLDNYAELPFDADLPFLVDILSCGHGCNAGTGSLRQEQESLSFDHCLYQAKMKAKKSTRKAIPGPDFKKLDKYLDLDDFHRYYSNRLVVEKKILPEQLETAYQRLNKYAPLDRQIDCRSCGYVSCTKMAEALAKGINHPENCVEYLKSEVRSQSEMMKTLAVTRERQAQDLLHNVESISFSLTQSTDQTEQTLEELRAINDRISLMNSVSSRLKDNIAQLRSQMSIFFEMSDEIVRISKQTDLLAINASVEANRNGQYSHGFGVVVEEIRRLSSENRALAQETIRSTQILAPALKEVDAFSDELAREALKISDNTESIVGSMSQLTAIQQTIAASTQQIAHSGALPQEV